MKLVTTTAALITSFFITQVISAPVGTTGNNNGLNGASVASIKHVKRVQCRANARPYVAINDDTSDTLLMEYSGHWTHLTDQDQSQYYDGTLSYTGQADAMVTIPTPFSAGATYRVDITIWSTKKRDRGEFNVYLGSRLLGTGDQYTSASAETDTQQVFSLENVLVEGGLPFVMKNDKGASYMALDAVQLEYCVYE